MGNSLHRPIRRGISALGLLIFNFISLGLHAQTQNQSYIVSPRCLDRAIENQILVQETQAQRYELLLRKGTPGSKDDLRYHRVYNWPGIRDAYKQSLVKLRRKIDDPKSEIFSYLFRCRQNDEECYASMAAFEGKEDLEDFFCDHEIYREALEDSNTTKNTQAYFCGVDRELHFSYPFMEDPRYVAECLKKTSGEHEWKNKSEVFEQEKQWIQSVWFRQYIDLWKQQTEQSQNPDAFSLIAHRVIAEFGNKLEKEQKLRHRQEFEQVLRQCIAYREGDLEGMYKNASQYVLSIMGESVEPIALNTELRLPKYRGYFDKGVTGSVVYYQFYDSKHKYESAKTLEERNQLQKRHKKDDFYIKEFIRERDLWTNIDSLGQRFSKEPDPWDRQHEKDRVHYASEKIGDLEDLAEKNKEKDYVSIHTGMLPFQFARMLAAKSIREIQKISKKRADQILSKEEYFYQWSDGLLCTNGDEKYCTKGNLSQRREKQKQLYDLIRSKDLDIEYAQQFLRKNIYQENFLHDLNTNIQAVNNYCWTVADQKRWNQEPNKMLEQYQSTLGILLENLYSQKRVTQEVLGDSVFYELTHFNPKPKELYRRCFFEGVVFGHLEDRKYSEVGYAYHNEVFRSHENKSLALRQAIEKKQTSLTRVIYLKPSFYISVDELEEIEGHIESELEKEWASLKNQMSINERYLYYDRHKPRGNSEGAARVRRRYQVQQNILIEQIEEYLVESSSVRLFAMFEYINQSNQKTEAFQLCEFWHAGFAQDEFRHTAVTVLMIAVAVPFLLMTQGAGMSLVIWVGAQLVVLAIDVALGEWEVSILNDQKSLINRGYLTGNIHADDALSLYAEITDKISNVRILQGLGVALFVVTEYIVVGKAIKFINQWKKEGFDRVFAQRSLLTDQALERADEAIKEFFSNEKITHHFFNREEVSPEEFQEILKALEDPEEFEELLQKKWRHDPHIGDEVVHEIPRLRVTEEISAQTYRDRAEFLSHMFNYETMPGFMDEHFIYNLLRVPKEGERSFDRIAAMIKDNLDQDHAVLKQLLKDHFPELFEIKFWNYIDVFMDVIFDPIKRTARYVAEWLGRPEVFTGMKMRKLYHLASTLSVEDADREFLAQMLTYLCRTESITEDEALELVTRLNTRYRTHTDSYVNWHESYVVDDVKLIVHRVDGELVFEPFESQYSKDIVENFIEGRSHTIHLPNGQILEIPQVSIQFLDNGVSVAADAKELLTKVTLHIQNDHERIAFIKSIARLAQESPDGILKLRLDDVKIIKAVAEYADFKRGMLPWQIVVKNMDRWLGRLEEMRLTEFVEKLRSAGAYHQSAMEIFDPETFLYIWKTAKETSLYQYERNNGVLDATNINQIFQYVVREVPQMVQIHVEAFARYRIRIRKHYAKHFDRMYKKLISRGVNEADAIIEANLYATRRKNWYKNAMRSCHARPDKTPRFERSLAYVGTKQSMTLQKVLLSVGGFILANYDKVPNAYTTKKLAKDVGFSMVGPRIAANIISNQKTGFWGKVGRDYSTFSLISFIDLALENKVYQTAIEDSLYQLAENYEGSFSSEKIILMKNLIENDEEISQAMDQFLQKYAGENALEELNKEQKLQQIMDQSSDYEAFNEFMLVLADRMYDESSGLIKTGNAGLDAFIFNRVLWAPYAVLKSTPLNILFYRYLCMSPFLDPKIMYVKIMSLMMLEKFTFSNALYYEGFNKFMAHLTFYDEGEVAQRNGALQSQSSSEDP